jgi:hypothetical protein
VLGNIDPISIDYAFQPRLRTRLTLGGFTFPRNPWAYGDTDFHRVYRYLSRHMHYLPLHSRFPSCFTAGKYALLPLLTEPAASALCLFPIIIGARLLDQ